MVKNIIRHNDNVYIVSRILSAATNEEDANRMHNVLGTDTLLRDKEGKWFCCNTTKEVQFRDVVKETVEPEDLSHTVFELGDNGGMG